MRNLIKNHVDVTWINFISSNWVSVVVTYQSHKLKLVGSTPAPDILWSQKFRFFIFYSVIKIVLRFNIINNFFIFNIIQLSNM